MTRGMWKSAAALALFAMVGCAGASSIGLTSEDNNPARLSQALALRNVSKAGAPMNAAGTPMAFLVTRANRQKNIGPKLIAFDLATKQERWRVETAVKSRVMVGREFIAHRDDAGKLVARALATGDVLWSAAADGFLGATADEERVFYVTVDKSRPERPVWYLVAVDGMRGAELWRTSAPGQLGAPSAHGGLVFSPFLKQWLAILDARTGTQIARIRGIDEEISFVRPTGGELTFGSRAGVFRLDPRAASGRRGESTYGRATLPEDFVRSHYHWDAFDPVQSGYSAYDRNRLLWRPEVRGEELGFLGDLIAVCTYRFFFGFDSRTGALRWAYNHPRVDAIGAEYVGSVIAFASGLGELGALDPGTGQRIYSAKIDEQLVGVTFDAEGWTPAEDGAPPSTVTALASIARDRDARFNQVKRFAVAALAALPGADVTQDLIELIQNERTPKNLHDKAVEVLISRKDTEGLEHVLSALATPHDFITGSRPRGVGVLARAVGALRDATALTPAQRGSAIEALLANLWAPDSAADDLVEVVRALGAVGAGAELAPLRSFLLMHRADPAFETRSAALAAAIDVLVGNGTAAERALVGFVAEDARTQKSVAEHARRALRPGAPSVQSRVRAADKSP